MVSADFLHSAEFLSTGEGFRVHLNQFSARTMLMDDVNFENYRNGRRFTAYGGWAAVSPVSLLAPYPGHWHVVLDLDGRCGTIQHRMEVIRRN